MKYCAHILLMGFMLLFAANQVEAQTPRTRILFLLDASGSMKNTWNDRTTESKWSSAKKILREIADSLRKEKNIEIGLRVYGHQSRPTERNCNDTQLEVGFSKNSFGYIQSKLGKIIPKGITPIAASLLKAGNDFPRVPGRHIIILMTDGEESCDGDPCAIARELEEKGIVMKHFVIGIGGDISTDSGLDCVGTYFGVSSGASFKNALQTILTRLVNETTLQVDLLNQAGQPKETDVNMSFYANVHKVFKNDFYHTLQPNGLPDTLSLDPVQDYLLVTHTLPPLQIEGIVLMPNKHNTIKMKTVQGVLNVNVKGTGVSQDLTDKMKCIVKKPSGEVVHIQPMNSAEEYLEGTYNLEILTLPRTYKQVKIQSGKPVNIELPTPGILELAKQFDVKGGIFMEKEGRLQKIYEISEDSKVEIVALLPGKYFIIYKPNFSKGTHSSKTLQVDVVPGVSANIKL